VGKRKIPIFGEEGLTVSNKLGIMWKQRFMTSFKAVSQHFSGEAEENYEGLLSR
jgi:hypothetical protein